MSVYFYNGIYIQYCRTLEFSVVQERDPYNVDSIYSKYTIRVRGFLSTSAGAFPGNGMPLSTATTLAQVKDALETPRRVFSYSVSDTTLVEVGTGLGSVSLDARLGPDPLPATVREITSGTFVVECGIVCRVVDCDNSCETRSPVLSLRWTQTESFDENWFSKLVTTGRLIVRSDLLQSADNFRPLCVPPLIADYKRMRSQYTLSPDGLTLDFTFEDLEFDRLPPNLATKASGTFTVVCERPGFTRVGQVGLELEGPKGSSRKALLSRAIGMAYSKLNSESFLQENGSPPIVWGEFTEDLFSPKVMVKMAAILTNVNSGGFLRPTLAGAAGGALGAVGAVGLLDAPAVMLSVGEPLPGTESNRTQLPPPARKRLAGLLTAAFRDPCACLVSDTKLTSSGSGDSGSGNSSMVGTAAGPADIGTASLSTLPPGPPLIRDLAPYDSWMVRTSSVFNSGSVQMPGTGVGPNGSVGVMVQAAGSIMEMTMTWVAGRTGKPPVLPTFESNNPNIVPLRGAVTSNNVVPSPDGTGLVYMSSGYFVYGVVNPNKFELTTTAPPFATELVSGGISQANGFWDGILGASVAIAQNSQSNPFVGGGVVEGSEPSTSAVQGLIINPLTGLPAGQFFDLSNAPSGTDRPPDLDPFFIVPKVNP